MGALTEARDYRTRGPVVILDIESAGDEVYYKGAMLVADSSGYASVPSDAANLVPLGVYTGRQGQELEVASGSHDKLEIETGLIWIPHSGAAQVDVCSLFYLGDDGDVVDTAGAKTWAVLCKGWKPGYLLLDFSFPVKTA